MREKGKEGKRMYSESVGNLEMSLQYRNPFGRVRSGRDVIQSPEGRYAHVNSCEK